MKKLVIALALLGGCKGWNVHAFDVPLDGKEPYVAAASDDEGLSSEEKWGVIVIVAVAVGASVAVAASN